MQFSTQNLLFRLADLYKPLTGKLSVRIWAIKRLKPLNGMHYARLETGNMANMGKKRNGSVADYLTVSTVTVLAAYAYLPDTVSIYVSMRLPLAACGGIALWLVGFVCCCYS